MRRALSFSESPATFSSSSASSTSEGSRTLKLRTTSRNAGRSFSFAASTAFISMAYCRSGVSMIATPYQALMTSAPRCPIGSTLCSKTRALTVVPLTLISLGLSSLNPSCAILQYFWYEVRSNGLSSSYEGLEPASFGDSAVRFFETLAKLITRSSALRSRIGFFDTHFASVFLSWSATGTGLNFSGGERAKPALAFL